MTDDPLVSPKDLARTYDAHAYADTWELVEDYRRTMEYAARRPELGSQALATRLDLPRSRIRPWIRTPDDDRKPARPDSVQGIQVAEARGWVPLMLETEAFRPLNELVAWIFSGGSIREDGFVPLFTVRGSSSRSHLIGLFDDLDLDYALVHEDDPDRATEYRPLTHASVLGRVFSVLSAPVGTKNPDASIRLPTYLEWAPESIRRAFVEVYLQNRGHRRDDTAVVTLREERSDRYLSELADLISDVSGGRVTVSEHNVILSADAVRALQA